MSDTSTAHHVHIWGSWRNDNTRLCLLRTCTTTQHYSEIGGGAR